MEVKNKVMYHYHKLGLYDNIWQVGNELIVSDNFNSYYGKIINNFNTAVKYNNGSVSLEMIIEKILKEIGIENIDLKTIEYLLKDSLNIITNTNIFNRELMLEDFRKDYFPNLPSRLHSIWVTDDKSLDFWEKQMSNNKKLVLYRVLLTGNLFKSSDSFIPDNELTAKEMYESSFNYWNPIFKEEDLCKAEYLFQGKVKVLEKIDK